MLWNPYLMQRVVRVTYNLPRDLPSEDVLKSVQWDSLFDMYKAKIYNIFNYIAPSCLEHDPEAREQVRLASSPSHDRSAFRNVLHEELHLVPSIAWNL